MSARTMFFSDDAEVISLAGEFYSFRLSPSKWDRATQLTVTLFYAIRFPYKMAFELIRDRTLHIGFGRYRTAEQRAELETNIHHWLQTSRSFATKYSNIEEISALVNIFISTYWNAGEPYSYNMDPAVCEVDTARLASATAVI